MKSQAELNRYIVFKKLVFCSGVVMSFIGTVSNILLTNINAIEIAARGDK
jgi:hypothetical protein